MKYRLKKDLPFAKAGTTVVVGGHTQYISVDGLTIGDNSNQSRRPNISDLIVTGWIEEVKAREFELGLDKDGCVTATSKECCIPIHVGNICKEIIKVREVL